jgi:lipoprotein-anchoring transpeptidase ErfK/SrfK
MPSGDIEQRVVRLDEVGLDRAQGRAQRSVEVDVGPASRGRRDDPERDQAHREPEQGTPRVAALVLLATALLAGCMPRPAEPPRADLPGLLDAEISLADDPPCPRIAHIEVRKRERRLVARCNPGPAVVMKVALGREPVGAKTSRGDHRTPEGTYVVSGPAQSTRFHRFIPIDYPSRRDADAALAAGAISATEHSRILARRAHDRPPPQDTALGGGLGLHGEGPRWRGESAEVDWTFGCIAVRDHEIDFLAQRVKVGTPVWIVP